MAPPVGSPNLKSVSFWVFQEIALVRAMSPWVTKSKERIRKAGIKPQQIEVTVLF